MREAIEASVGFFVKNGLLAKVPSPWQVRVGWMAMLPITLSESARERERSRRTWLGQVPVRVPLQVLYNPRQLIADTGIANEPRQIVRHVISVYHEDAFLGYDLQLLQSHPGGLALLRREAERVVNGETRWAPLLSRLVGWPGYHEGLIALADRAERFEYPDPLDLDRRFASLVGFAELCASMPDWPAREFYGFDLDRLAR